MAEGAHAEAPGEGLPPGFGGPYPPTAAFCPCRSVDRALSFGLGLDLVPSPRCPEAPGGVVIDEAGGLEVGITLQQTVVSGSNPCSPTTGADPIFGIRQRASGTGAVWVARFDRRDVGTSAEVDARRHEVRLAIGDGVEYKVAGNTVQHITAASVASKPARVADPGAAQRARRMNPQPFEKVLRSGGAQADHTPVAKAQPPRSGKPTPIPSIRPDRVVVVRGGRP